MVQGVHRATDLGARTVTGQGAHTITDLGARHRARGAMHQAAQPRAPTVTDLGHPARRERGQSRQPVVVTVAHQAQREVGQLLLPIVLKVVLVIIMYIYTVKFQNFGTPEIFAVIYLEFKQRGQTLRVFCQNGANGIANSEDPDQTAPRLFAQTYLRVIMVLCR